MDDDPNAVHMHVVALDKCVPRKSIAPPFLAGLDQVERLQGPFQWTAHMVRRMGIFNGVVDYVSCSRYTVFFNDLQQLDIGAVAAITPKTEVMDGKVVQGGVTKTTQTKDSGI